MSPFYLSEHVYIDDEEQEQVNCRIRELESIISQLKEQQLAVQKTNGS